MKTTKLWNYLRQQMVEERGVWQIEKPLVSSKTTVIRYKYDKTEDCNRRRMRLKVDKRASEAVYLTKEAFEDLKYRKQSENAILCMQYEVNTPKHNLLDQSTTSELSPDNSRVGGMSNQMHKKVFNYMNTNELMPLGGLGLTRAQSANINDVKNPHKVKEPGEKYVAEDLKGVSKEEVLKKNRENEFLLGSERSQKKISLHCKCERITMRGAIWGDIELSEAHLTFSPDKNERPDLDDFRLGSLKENFITSRKKKQWNLSNIRQIYTRRYNYVYSAFEILTTDYKAYYFNLYSPKILSECLQKFKSLKKDLIITNKENFLDSDHQKRWIEGKLSNFDYIMYLNTVSGRSYNDLTQYPVFPWILADYTSSELNIHTQDSTEQEKIFRDLSLPVGAQLKDKHKGLKSKIEVEELLQKYGRIEPDDGTQFMYGSHYSTGGHIIDYLVRVEPFTSLQIKLQSGRFDDANRIFSSIPKAWAVYVSEHNTQNFKELVPEFFYCPNFLKNKYFTSTKPWSLINIILEILFNLERKLMRLFSQTGLELQKSSLSSIGKR